MHGSSVTYTVQPASRHAPRAADACRILSIFAVILSRNPGLALVLLLVLPLFAVFTRHVQKLSLIHI